MGISEYKHIKCHPLSRESFQQDLQTCGGVICNSGFELVSEALELGKNILVKPVFGQAEQISNALALTKLGYGSSMNTLDSSVVKQWLQQNQHIRVSYHNVARKIVSRMLQGRDLLDTEFIKRTWENVWITDNR
jgi:uncharacterized protein (TIGR00661 family)